MIRACLFALFVSNFTCLISQTAEEYRTIGIEAFEQGDTLAAYEAFTKAISLDPKNPKRYLSRSWLLLNTGRFEEAKADAEMGAQVSDTCSDCWFQLATIAGMQKDYQTSRKLVENALKIDQKNGDALVLRAKLRDIEGDKFWVLEDFDKAIRYHPDNPVYYAERASYNLNQGYTARAIEDLNKAFSLDSSMMEVLYLRAQAHANVQNWARALDDLTKCIELDTAKDASRYYLARGTVYNRMGNTNKEMEDFNKAIELDKENPLAYINRSFTRYQLEDMDGACEDNEKALSLIQPNSPDSIYIKRIKASLENFCEPNSAAYFYQRGIARYNLKKFEDAVTMYQKGLKQFPESTMLHFFEGNAHMALADYESAEIAYKKALIYKKNFTRELQSDHASRIDVEMAGAMNEAGIMGSLSEVYMHLSKFDEAGKYADSSIVLMTKYQRDPEIRNQLSAMYNQRGVILMQGGDMNESALKFNEAILLSDRNAWAYTNRATYLLYKDAKIIKPQKGNMIGTANSSNSFQLPVAKTKKLSASTIQSAIADCDKAIQTDPDLGYAYLVRAYAKMAGGKAGVCEDAIKAKQLGITDALQQLGVNCSE